MRTIVDPTVIGLGRYIPRIQRVAEQVPELNIVVGDRLLHLRERARSSSTTAGRRSATDLPDPMVDMFVGDITTASPARA